MGRRVRIQKEGASSPPWSLLAAAPPGGGWAGTGRSLRGPALIFPDDDRAPEVPSAAVATAIPAGHAITQPATSYCSLVRLYESGSWPEPLKLHGPAAVPIAAAVAVPPANAGIGLYVNVAVTGPMVGSVLDSPHSSRPLRAFESAAHAAALGAQPQTPVLVTVTVLGAGYESVCGWVIVHVPSEYSLAPTTPSEDTKRIVFGAVVTEARGPVAGTPLQRIAVMRSLPVSAGPAT